MRTWKRELIGAVIIVMFGLAMLILADNNSMTKMPETVGAEEQLEEHGQEEKVMDTVEMEKHKTVEILAVSETTDTAKIDEN